MAALFAAAILRRNPDSVVIPFDDKAYHVKLDPQDTILSLAERLAKYGGGGTNCSLPLAETTSTYISRRFPGCVLVSDQESWIGTGRYGSTATMTAWQEFVNNQVMAIIRWNETELLRTLNIAIYQLGWPTGSRSSAVCIIAG